MQSRLIYFIAGLFAVTIIAVAMLQQSPQMSEDEIKALVNQAVEERIAAIEPQSAAPASPASSIETSELGPVIEDYLMANPSLLQRMSVALQEETNREQAAQAKLALASLKGPIYDDPDHVVLGNPEGDVTIVEFFDYNCGFCRQALADVMQLLDEDTNVRVILKEYPILSQGSADAARIAVLVAQDPNVSYMDFHTRLFATRGQVDKAAALAAAQSLGMNPVDLELRMGEKSVTDAITRNYQVADALNITSTPNFIIGDEILRGAVGIDEMRTKIKNMRDCGKATCNL